MIKHIIKIIWAQRRSNIWIVGELLLVVCAVWFMLDKLWVDMRCYYAPMGYDIENTWRFRLSRLSQQAPGFVPDSLRETSDTQDLLALMDRIRSLEEVEEACVTVLVDALVPSVNFVGEPIPRGRGYDRLVGPELP